jgi:hypothetical protein
MHASFNGLRHYMFSRIIPSKIFGNAIFLSYTYVIIITSEMILIVFAAIFSSHMLTKRDKKLKFYHIKSVVSPKSQRGFNEG